MANLSSLYNGTATRTLPNGGGSYQSPTVLPPLFPNGVNFAPPVSPVVDTTKITPAVTAQSTAPVISKYINPKTGGYYTPQEYANSVASKIPASKNMGDVSKTAGDALMNPDQTTSQLTTTARNLNNARNDIATGATDPYKVGADSGIAYSPTELAAIEKAYAGVYDPALNDVFTRLKDKKDQEAAKQKQADEIFQTNEAIRQWRATTGTGPTYSGAGGNQFTKTQLNTGASKAGMDINAFNLLDDDLKNFYINTPKGDDGSGKAVPMDSIFDAKLKEVAAGTLTADEVTADIMDSSLSPAVKHYFVDKIPAAPEKKAGWIEGIWNWATGQQ